MPESGSNAGTEDTPFDFYPNGYPNLIVIRARIYFFFKVFNCSPGLPTNPTSSINIFD